MVNAAQQDGSREKTRPLTATPVAASKATSSSETPSTANQICNVLAFLDLPLEQISTLGKTLSENARYQEDLLLDQVRKGKLSRELLAKQAVSNEGIPEQLKDMRAELEVAGMQCAYALLYRGDRSLSLDLYRVSEAHDSAAAPRLLPRLERFYTECFANSESVMSKILGSVNSQTSSDGNAAFLRGFLQPFFLITRSDERQSNLVVNGSAFSALAASNTISPQEEQFLKTLCPKDSAPKPATPAQVAVSQEINPRLKAIFAESWGAYTAKMKGLRDFLAAKPSLSGKEAEFILNKISARKRLLIEYEGKLPDKCLEGTKYYSDSYVGIDLAFQAASLIDAKTLTPKLHSKIFSRLDDMAEDVGKNELLVQGLQAKIPFVPLIIAAALPPTTGIGVGWPIGLSVVYSLIGLIVRTGAMDDSYENSIKSFYIEFGSAKRQIKQTRANLKDLFEDLANEKLKAMPV